LAQADYSRKISEAQDGDDSDILESRLSPIPYNPVLLPSHSNDPPTSHLPAQSYSAILCSASQAMSFYFTLYLQLIPSNLLLRFC